MEQSISRDEHIRCMGRIDEMSKTLAKTEERSHRNEEDVKNLYVVFESKSKDFSKKADQIGAKADKISTSVLMGAVVLVLGLMVKELILRQ